MAPNGRLHGLLLTSSVILGAQFPATKFVVGTMDPLSLTAFRIALGVVAAVISFAVLRRWDARVFRNPYSWVLGGLLALVYLFMNLGMERTTASKAALLVNVSVAYVAVFMVVVFREAVTVPRATGVVASIGGVVVLTTNLDLGFLSGGQVLGDFLVFLAGLTWAVFVIVAKRMTDQTAFQAAHLSGAVLTVTAALAFFPLLWTRGSVPGTLLGWCALLFLGLISTYLPLWLFIHSLRTVSPTVSAILIVPAVLVAAVLSFALLGDSVGTWTILGGGLVLGGAFLATREPKSGAPTAGPRSLRPGTR